MDIEDYVFRVTNLADNSSARYRINAGGNAKIIPEEGLHVIHSRRTTRFNSIQFEKLRNKNSIFFAFQSEIL